MNHTSVIPVIIHLQCPTAPIRHSRAEPAPGSIGGGNPEMPRIRDVAGRERFWIPGQSLPRTGYGARNDGLRAGKINRV